MKKFFKSILTVSLLLATLNIETIASHASSDMNQLDPMQPTLRARVCICGNGVYRRVNYDEKDWQIDHQEKCIDGKPYGVDLVFKKLIIETYKCSNCGRGYESTHYETKRECHGFY